MRVPDDAPSTHAQTLTLRPVVESDLPVLEALATEAVSGHNWSGHVTSNYFRRRFDLDGFLGDDDGWLIAADGGGSALASVGFRAFNWGRPPYSRAWSIGVTVAPAHRRRGIATRAQRLLCDYLFLTTNVNRVEAVTAFDNVGEQRALQAAGFTLEGTIRQAEFHRGRWQDLQMYSVLRSEWQQESTR